MTLRFHPFQRLTLHLRTPLRTAKGELRVREGWVVRIEADGVIGAGEAMPLPSSGTESFDACSAALSAASAALDGAALGHALSDVGPLLSRCLSLKEAPAARHAVECALLDLLAQHHRRPVCGLLSDAPRDRVQVNALLGSVDAPALADEAQLAVDAGFGVLKIKVGGRPCADDVQRVGAVRRRVGANVAIRIDANGAWALKEAADNLRHLGESSLELCEQPVNTEDLPAFGRDRAQLACRIAADESLARPGDVDALLPSQGAPLVDVLVLKPMVLGGLLPALRLAERAHQRGVACYVTSTLDGPLARTAAAHLAASLPEPRYASGLATGHLFETEPAGSLPMSRGHLLLEDAPGFGSSGRAA